MTTWCLLAFQLADEGLFSPRIDPPTKKGFAMLASRTHIITCHICKGIRTYSLLSQSYIDFDLGIFCSLETENMSTRDPRTELCKKTSHARIGMKNCWVSKIVGSASMLFSIGWEGCMSLPSFDTYVQQAAQCLCRLTTVKRLWSVFPTHFPGLRTLVACSKLLKSCKLVICHGA